MEFMPVTTQILAPTPDPDALMAVAVRLPSAASKIINAARNKEAIPLSVSKTIHALLDAGDACRESLEEKAIPLDPPMVEIGSAKAGRDESMVLRLPVRIAEKLGNDPTANGLAILRMLQESQAHKAQFKNRTR
jgi:hypothetical protein